MTSPMKKTFFATLALTLGFLTPARAAASPDQAIGNLLDAAFAPSAAFDGSRPGSGAVFAPVSGRYHLAPGAAKPAGNPTSAALAPQTPEAPADVAPTSARGISGGHVGLYSEDDFELGTGRCSLCRGPREGKWYFLDEVIATPKSGPPALVWIGSHELIEGATLSKDGTTIRLPDGTEMPFALTPQIASNRSYYDASSVAFLSARTLRIRGEFALVNGVRTLVARTIWPEDFKITPEALGTADAASAGDIDKLVAADKGGTKKPFSAKLLWEKPGAERAWTDKPVMGFMLNGGQGDDDEALAGHFSFFTGVYPAGGSMADWMFDNFYDMDLVSEKGIVASMVPMDKYMADLNSGQSWYRPTDMLVLVMKDKRAPLQLQEKFKDQYAKYYSHEIKYDRTHKTCAALIVDPLKEEGWRVPEQGPTPKLIALAFSKAIGLKDPEAGKNIYATLREEPTRVFPRASFDSAGGQLLSMAGADGAEPLGRELSPFEKQIQEDLVAILFVRLPQLPSSRAFGSDPAGGVFDYFKRTPLDRAKWKTTPSVPRSFPPAH
jgi:hypothetical protein